MDIGTLPGVFDILPKAKDLWRSSYLWQYVEAVCRKLAHDYALSEIRTPLIERADLFCRAVGEETDIVAKEMYVFQDRGGREIALRPEGTVSVMRALIENNEFTPIQTMRYFYIGPMFRYDRPQAGRYRQHHQFGVEIVGIEAPEQDAEAIAMMMQLFSRLGLPHLTAHINSLGNATSRANFREALLKYLEAHIGSMSEDSQRRFVRNPLRILDSKDPHDQEIVAKAPSILDYLSHEDGAHFERVKEMLSALGIPYHVSPLLVRGLDYYQKTVFEVTSGKLGAQNSLGGGGRYDGLLQQLGGPELPLFGFGTGLERIIQVLIREGLAEKISPPELTLVIVPMDEKARGKALSFAEELRRRSVRCLVDYTGKRIKNAVAAAADAGACWLLVLGERELETGVGALKFLADGAQTEVSLDQVDVLVHRLLSRHGEKEAVQ